MFRTKCLRVVLVFLLADAEVGKYVGEGFLGGDFAEDVGEGGEDLADVLGDEVAGEPRVHAVFGASGGLEGAAEGFEVAGVGENGLCA